MHVVLFAEFMAMESWAPHQTLKAEGKLREFDESMRGRTFFISHQWTSFNHPRQGKRACRPCTTCCAGWRRAR